MNTDERKDRLQGTLWMAAREYQACVSHEYLTCAQSPHTIASASSPRFSPCRA